MQTQKPKQLDIEIDVETGDINIDIIGMIGNSCETFAKEELEPLFGKRTSERVKPEINVRTNIQQKVKR